MIQFTGTDLGFRFRELAGTEEGAVQASLQGARSYVDEGTFGADAREALMLYTAHLLVSSDPARRGGAQITEERVGDVAHKFANNPASENVDSNGYLDQFKRLCQKVSAGGFAAAG